MPRKPNYKFERMERERAKAAKKAARKQERLDRKAATTAPDGTVVAGDDGAGAGAAVEGAPLAQDPDQA